MTSRPAGKHRTTLHEWLSWVLEYQPEDVDEMLLYVEDRILDEVLGHPDEYQYRNGTARPRPDRKGGTK